MRPSSVSGTLHTGRYFRLHASTTAAPLLLGLLAAATWGAADFAGGLATRRAAPSRVVLTAHGLSFLLLFAASLAMPAQLAPGAAVYALLSGIAGGLGLMVFYEALALGVMGLAAALAGLLTAVLPVTLAFRSQGAPGPMQLAGFALAAVAIVLIAYAPPASGARTSRRALVFATVAGVGFGLQLVWLHAASAPHQPAAGSPAALMVRALMLSRVGGTLTALGAVLLARLRRQPFLPPAAAPTQVLQWLPLPALAALAGLLDTTGNGLYMLSSLGGRLDVAAVLSSLYPGGTILLAMLFLRERATRLQAAGMVLALGAVALIAA